MLGPEPFFLAFSSARLTDSRKIGKKYIFLLDSLMAIDKHFLLFFGHQSITGREMLGAIFFRRFQPLKTKPNQMWGSKGI